MSTAAKRDSAPRAVAVTVTDSAITAYLADGRTIAVPLAWSWRLAEATSAQRQRWELIAGGTGIRWPDVDEDISVRGMLEGGPAPRRRS